MSTSPRGRALLDTEEGTVLRVYLDQVGRPTVGRGHLVRPGDGLKLGDVITLDRCEALFTADLAPVEDAINALVRIQPTQNQFDAMVSLTFNIGSAGFATSTVLHCLNVNDVAGAAAAFALWNKGMVNGVKVVLPILTARRAREAALFLEPAT